jgi:hypothetical protein
MSRRLPSHENRSNADTRCNGSQGVTEDRSCGMRCGLRFHQRRPSLTLGGGRKATSDTYEWASGCQRCARTPGWHKLFEKLPMHPSLDLQRDIHGDSFIYSLRVFDLRLAALKMNNCRAPSLAGMISKERQLRRKLTMDIVVTCAGIVEHCGTKLAAQYLFGITSVFAARSTQDVMSEDILSHAELFCS